jgi:hypothetical protein
MGLSLVIVVVAITGDEGHDCVVHLVDEPMFVAYAPGPTLFKTMVIRGPDSSKWTLQ